MSFRNILLLLWVIGFFCSCSNTRHLHDGESLFLGGKVKITDKQADNDELRVLKTDLNGAIRPRPNSTILGVRFKLWMYNVGGGTKKTKGLRRAIKKAGEPPVLASSFNPQSNHDLFVNILNNRGFFQPQVDVETKTRRKKTKAYFTVATGPQYKIRNVAYVQDSSQASKDMMAARGNSLLKEGGSYNLDVIKGERERIDKLLKENGYFYFKPDYILVKVDSTVGDHQVDMYVTLKHDEIPDEAYKIYSIHDVYIYPNYRLNAQRADTNKTDADYYEGYYVVDRRKTYRPIVFKQAMQFKPGDIYNRTDHNVSLNRIISLGTFKFVKNRFEPVDTSAAMLDAFYYLTPFPKKSLRFEIGALTQNDSRAGSQASIAWKNRNTFRGAELFQIKLNGGFEAQYSGEVHQPNTYQAGIEMSLSIPRFAVPFVTIPSSSIFIPRTYIKAGYTLETRSGLFRIHSIKGSYGFDWKRDIRLEHQLYPINVTYVRTDTLGNPDGQTIDYSNLVFTGFIIGPTYEFTYNSQAGTSRKNNFYFDGLADFSGTYTGLNKTAMYGEQPKQLLGGALAEYLKFQGDFRYYYNFWRRAQWVNRLFTGLGYPYGASFQLPNIKQFFSGGNSSLRGFRSRLVGPGTFNEQYLTGDQTYIELLGDVKLEFNSELRFDIYQFLKGAVFFDAGNVWLYNKNPKFPGGVFSADFYKEYAADMGLGLRFDFKIILLRLDLGMPVRKPWMPEGQRWVFNQIDFGDSHWRAQNLILNIAIGYPF